MSPFDSIHDSSERCAAGWNGKQTKGKIGFNGLDRFYRSGGVKRTVAGEKRQNAYGAAMGYASVKL